MRSGHRDGICRKTTMVICHIAEATNMRKGSWHSRAQISESRHYMFINKYSEPMKALHLRNMIFTVNRHNNPIITLTAKQKN
jgi:hypothetical protein